jgi:hypothetical protein
VHAAYSLWAHELVGHAGQLQNCHREHVSHGCAHNDGAQSRMPPIVCMPAVLHCGCWAYLQQAIRCGYLLGLVVYKCTRCFQSPCIALCARGCALYLAFCIWHLLHCPSYLQTLKVFTPCTSVDGVDRCLMNATRCVFVRCGRVCGSRVRAPV